MTVAEVAKLLDAEVLCGQEMFDTVVENACGSDMMSDVLAFVKNQSVLLTGLVNAQVIRTAEMMDMKCVIFVRGKTPDKLILDLAKELGICILSTRHRMFSACGILYKNGLNGQV